MTVANQTSKIRFTGNGVTVDFDFDFKIFDEGDLEVYLIDNDTEEAELQTIDTDYTVEILTAAEGGTVTMLAAPDSDHDLLVRRVLDRIQNSNLPPVSQFPERKVENALDRVTMIVIEQDEILARCLRLGDTVNTSGISLELPTPQAGAALVWNDDEDALENDDLEVTETQYDGTISKGLDAAKPATPGAGDIYIATDTQKVYRCFTAGTWTTGQTFANPINEAKGADITSVGGTPDIGAATGNFVHITGTTTITAFGTVQAGTRRTVRFAGILTLTHHATSLILPTAANITTAANDVAQFISEGSGNWRCTSYLRADGTAVGATTSPSFRAYRNGAQTISHDTATKIQLNAESFDSHSYFDSATNFRFTPLVAGKYLVTAQARLNVQATDKFFSLYIYKNGSFWSASADAFVTGPDASVITVGHSDILDLNGSTDYIEIYFYHNEGGNKDLEGSANYTFAAAAKIG